MRRSTRLLPLVVAFALASGGGLTSATADDVVAQQIPGQLIGVGANQQSLVVAYTNDTIPDCGTIGAVNASAVYTATNVAVTLTAEVTGEETDVACGGVGMYGTTTVALPQPIAGRAISGLAVHGGALSRFYGHGTDGKTLTMPNLVGLAPADARALLSVGAQETPEVGLVDHRLNRGSNPVPMVIAQRPAAGKPLRQGTIVVLTVEK